jgi:hypothetical protein
MNYLVPRDVTVVSSGSFIKQTKILQGQLTKTLHVFKSKPTKITPDKIGFIVGNFPYVSTLESTKGKNMGAALFISS